MVERNNENLILFLMFSKTQISMIGSKDIILTSSDLLDFFKDNYSDNLVYSVNEFEIPFRKIVDNANGMKEKLKTSSFIAKTRLFLMEANFNVIINNIFIPVFKWQIALDDIISNYKINQVVISDKAMSVDYMPFYEAEGEIHRPLFYKKFDFIPSVLEQYLKDKHGIVTSYINSRGKFKLALRIFLRRYVFLFFLVFSYLVKKVFSLRSNFNRSVAFNKKKEKVFLFLSRGIAHSHYFYPFVKRFDNSITHVGESFFEISKNHNFFIKNKLSSTQLLQNLSFIDIFQAFYQCVKLLVTSREKIKVEILGLTFPYSSMEKEMMIAFFHLYIYEKSIESYLLQLDQAVRKKIVLISGEMFTAFPWIVKRLAEKYQLKSYQVQTTLMMSYPQVDFIACDKFLFKSDEVLRLYKENNPKYDEKMAYWGSFLSINEPRKITGTKLLFFTQPYEEHNEEFILRNLQKNNFDQKSIKLHPRDNEQKFNEFIEEFAFVSGDSHLSDYLEGIDICIVRTSSIAQDIILTGTPIIFCLFSDIDKKIEADYIVSGYYGNAYSIEDLFRIINNPQLLFESFVKFQKSYIEVGKLGKGVDCFYDEIIKIE